MNAGYYLLLAAVSIYALVNQILILNAKAQMRFWLEQRNVEIKHHKEELSAAIEGARLPFPPGRVIKEGLYPLPPADEPKVKQAMTQDTFDSLEHEIRKMRGNESTKYMILKKLYREHPQFAK